MLTTVERWAIVTSLVEKMRSNGGWASETHIQKTMYFLGSMLEVPVSYEFVLYKHGPYSFNLHDDLGRMRANRILKIEPQRPYGPSYGLGTLGSRSMDRGKRAVKKYEPQMTFATQFLSRADVRTLERLATAWYVKSKNPGSGPTALAEIVSQLKPHIDAPTAREALESISRLVEKAKSKELIQ